MQLPWPLLNAGVANYDCSLLLPGCGGCGDGSGDGCGDIVS